MTVRKSGLQTCNPLQRRLPELIQQLNENLESLRRR